MSSLLAFACIATMNAQEFRATISGHVFDSSGAAIPDARIQATNIANNETSQATTNNAGVYSIPFLRPGLYKLTVSADGFKSYVRENITLQVGQIAGIDISLEVGAITETVEVTSQAALLETQTASRSGVVNTQQVAELPLNARNPFMLGTMMSGVTFRGAAIWQRPFDNGAIAQWSVNGGRQSNNEFMLDGAPNNAQAGGNNIAYVPIVDAVQEFNVQMNSYDAQYGKTGGGVFNVVLKSGTNDFHATGWEFMRRKWLDANTFQGNAVPRASGVKNERADHTLDQYGFQLEGPVYLPKWLKKDSPVKLYYLGSFENYREKTPNPLTNSYPEPEMRTGDFSKLVTSDGKPITIYDPLNATDPGGNPIRSPFPNNRIPQARISPVAAAVSAFMPLPNSPARAGSRYSTNNFLIPEYVNNDKFYNLILKFDWNFGDNHRAFFRHASNDRTEDRAVNGIDNKVGTDGQQPFQRINDAYVADWVATLTPTIVLNIRGSYNRFIEKGLGRANADFDLTSLGLPSSLVSQLPGPTFFGRWEFTGYSPLGRYQSINITNNYNLAANLTLIKGAHTMKAGIDLRRGHYILQNTGNILLFQNSPAWTQRLYNQGEATSGDGYASFLLGTPTGGSSNYPVFPFFRQWYFAPYFQDDWKVSRKLTLNLGLRWDYNGPTDEKYNRINRGFDPKLANPIAGEISAANLALYPQLKNLSGGLLFAGVNGQPTIAYKRDLNNWQPRVGFAYSMNDRLVIRGGYGLYYLNPTNDAQISTGFQTTTPLVSSLDDNRTPLPNVYSNPFPTINKPAGAALGALTFAGQNSNWFNPNFNIPLMHQFSLGFQYQTTQTSTIELSYVGSRSRGLNDERDYNIPTLDFRKQCNLLEGGSAAYCDAQVPNPFKGIEAFRGTSYFTASNISRFNMNRPFPQFNGVMQQKGLDTSDIWYNSLQVNYNQRVGDDLTIVTNYTFSKMVEQWGFNDPYVGIAQRGLYFLDHPHYFKFTTVYELPFGKGKKFASGVSGVTDKLLSGWQLTTFYTNSSGEPTDLPGNVFQLRDASIADIDWKAHQVRGFKACTERLFNNGTTSRINCAAGEDPYWLMLPSYAPRATPTRSGQIRKHQAFTMDASLNKMTQITERLRVQFRAEAFNIFNHNYFGRDSFNTDPTNPNFGTVFPSTVSNQNSFPRQIQFGFKVFW
ncbi:MAG: carboxypeptidase regulatory-like domain-containing protein [Bryobacterales bacterium]|nr:carboxypeptidase regulatory-like domain-containing protein [Bryobacterales bacterium]